MTKIHFMGINGSGCIGVACMAKNKGYDVCGCDLKKDSSYSKQLESLNINVEEGHNPEHITKDVDMVIITPALLYNNKYKEVPEALKAFRQKETITWQKFLNDYIVKDGNMISVAGTHGKTTTTSFLSLLLERANFDPSCMIGGTVKEWDKTYRVGKSDWYVVESDEFGGNFLNYNPKYIIINNIEMEHPEYFKGVDDYEVNFSNFLKNIKNNGKVFFNYDDENSRKVVGDLQDFLQKKNVEIIAYSFDKNVKSDFCKISYVEHDNLNSYKIDNTTFKLVKLFGEHNIKNMIIATLLAKSIGISNSIIQEQLNEFTGCGRRLDLVFKNDNIELYDDYGHHHTQIKCTLEALRNKNKTNKLVAILEPHLVSRFQQNCVDYIRYLNIADYAIITRFFKSREDFKEDLDMNLYLSKAKNIDYIPNNIDIINKVKDYIKFNTNDKISIVVMGAGLSYKLTQELSNNL